MHFLNSANVVRKGLGIVKISQKPEQINTSEFKPLDEGSEAHWEVVERILFVYCKLNPGQGYVQGMNEIIGPIYYCFATDPIVKMKGIKIKFLYLNILLTDVPVCNYFAANILILINDLQICIF